MTLVWEFNKVFVNVSQKEKKNMAISASNQHQSGKTTTRDKTNTEIYLQL